MRKAHIGIDNGTSGTVGCIITEDDKVIQTHFIRTPTYSEQNYQLKKQNITRIDYDEFADVLLGWVSGIEPENIHVGLEIPFSNLGRVKVMAGSMRAHEATLIALQEARLHSKTESRVQYIISTHWQKALLPKGTMREAIKQKGIEVATAVFPAHQKLYTQRKTWDADGMLIAMFVCSKISGKDWGVK